MQLSVNSNDPRLPYATQRLVKRMVSPLCGLDRMLVFTLRDRLGPRIIISGAELTGVHLLLNQSEPGSYHIGGAGVVRYEAVIRTLGETVERYSQFISVFNNRYKIMMATYEEMTKAGKKIPTVDRLSFFSEQQYSTPGFPFHPFDSTTPLGWVKTISLINGSEVWVPAQLVMLGYTLEHSKGEPWLLTAVTTGTAAHTSRNRALRNALLELIQVDAAMGHWYSAATAPQIMLDNRTKRLERIIKRHFLPPWSAIRFHWVDSADLGGFTVACVIMTAQGQIPAGCVGMGSDLRLVPAMYKALLEAVGVLLLAKLNHVQRVVGNGNGHDGNIGDSIDPTQIFDLDNNVSFYALPENAWYIDEKFATDDAVYASELPADSDLETDQEIRFLIDKFRKTEKELIFLDLTADDCKQLGFVTARVWSPETLSLCLPSAPPTQHPRFSSYGGVSHCNPHPYP